LAKHQAVLVRVSATLAVAGKLTGGELRPKKMPGNEEVPPPKKQPLPKKAPPAAKAPQARDAPSPAEIKVDIHAEVTGTVLSAGGLIAISSSSLTSSGLDGLESSLDSLMGLAFSGFGERRKPKSEKKGPASDKGKSENKIGDVMDGIEIKEVMIRFHDGREVAGRIVGVDRKHDVTFLRPAKELTKLRHMTLTAGAAQLDVLDEVIVLYPLSKASKRRIAVSNLRIAAAPDKKGSVPVLDIPASNVMLGCPAFDADGRSIGIVTSCAPPTTSNATLEMGDIENVILGAEQIRAALKRLEK
jgi:hypothetical protein